MTRIILAAALIATDAAAHCGALHTASEGQAIASLAALAIAGVILGRALLAAFAPTDRD